MKHIDAAQLESLHYRVDYARQFLNFTEEDQAALHAAKTYVAPLIPTILDAVYAKLLSFDITAKSFLPRNTGYTDVVASDVKELNQDHPAIKYRKNFLKQYLVKLVTADYQDPKTYEYFDRVALMHTGTMGVSAMRKGKSPLRVEYIHMGLLLGYVVEIIVPAVMALDVDDNTKGAVIRALNKVVWIQNDMFARYYMEKEEPKTGLS